MIRKPFTLFEPLDAIDNLIDLIELEKKFEVRNWTGHDC